MSKSQTGFRPQTLINKDLLSHLISIRSKNTDIAKTFNVARHLVACCVKFRGFTDVLREPEDDNEIMQVFCEVHQFHKSFGYRYSVGHLRNKGIKVKQVKMWLTLKNIKNFQTVSMEVIRH